MKKSLFFFAAAALALTACSNDDATQQAQAVAAPQAVAFDTYTAGTTRSGQTDVMTTTLLQSVGFGVFAYQTDNGNYSKTESKPNFMYNQQVTYGASAWTYSPLKYWPNETDDDAGTTNTPNSYSITDDEIDKVSFFAYAPYVATADPSTGNVTSASIADTDASGSAVPNVGITQLTGNDAAGDPKVSYQIAYTPSKSVDLIWGIAPATTGLSYTNVHNTSTSITAEEPLKDLIKPSVDQKIKFYFKHALARLGLKVVAAVDQTVPGGTIDSKTKIVIKEITITGASAKANGILNLNNTTAGTSLWDTSAGTALSIKLDYTGKGELAEGLRYADDGAGSYAKTGVTTSEQDVITGGKYFMLIPTHASETFTVGIKYVVITQDANVNTGYVVTENKIKKNVTISNFTNNKAYTFKLILGMTSVKLDAEVAEWELETASQIDLPKNKE